MANTIPLMIYEGEAGQRYCDPDTAYYSETFQGMELDSHETLALKQAVTAAEEHPAVVLLNGYLEQVTDPTGQQARDRFTLQHQARVGGLAAATAVRLGSGPELARDAAISGMVHDVGKRFLQHIIHIDGRLTDGQFQSVKPHVFTGAQMVAASGLCQPIVRSVGNHHGYQPGAYSVFPERLYDRLQIGPLSPEHLIGTTLAVADVTDAMRSARPGRPQPLPLAAVFEAVAAMPVPDVVKQAHRSLFAQAEAEPVPMAMAA